MSNSLQPQEAQALKQGGGFEITNYEDFERLMNRFESDADYLKHAGQQAGNYVKQLSGATKRILSDVKL